MSAALGLAPGLGLALPDLVAMAPSYDGSGIPLFLQEASPTLASLGASLLDLAVGQSLPDWQASALAAGALLAGASIDPAIPGALSSASAAAAAAPADAYSLSLDDDPVLLGNDGIDDELTGGDATVTGYRDSSYSGGGTSAGGSTGSGGETSSGDYGDTGGSTDTTAPNDCRDRNALEGADEIKAEPDDATHEHGSLVYIADGKTLHSPPIQGEPRYIPLAAVEKWMTDNNITPSQIIGFVHNHPERVYGGTDEAVRINSYPSGFDWNFADHMVAKGAGSGGNGFALYIINPDGALREFDYSSGTFYKSIGLDQKKAGIALPPELRHDGTSC